MIPGNGRGDAAIMLIEDWGSKEDEVNELAISGKREAIMRSMFGRHGTDYNETYRTLLLKEYFKPHRNKAVRGKDFKAVFNKSNYPNILTQEILEIRPNIIVPLGEFSLQFLTGYTNINNYRGSVLPLTPIIQQQIPEKTVRIIPTYGAERLWAEYKSRVYVNLDFKKIISLQARIDPIETEGVIWVCRSVEHFRTFLSRQTTPDFCVFDIETYLGFPTAISFCFDGKESVSIPLTDEKIDMANGALLLKEIARILSSNIGKVNQNIKYDVTILERFGLPVNNIIGDTMLGFHLLYPELPKSLAFQNSIYTNLPYFKDESNSKEAQFNPKMYTKDTLYLYNAKDSLATYQIHKKQQEELEEVGVLSLYKERIMPLFFIYKDMDCTGLRVDETKRKRLKFKYETHYNINLEWLHQKIGREINPHSPKQVGELIYDELKFPKREKTTEGRVAYRTDKDTLDDLIVQFPERNKYGAEGSKVLRLIIACRKFAQLVKYIDTPIHPDGVWRSSSNLCGTETGRTSQSKSIDSIWIKDSDGKIKSTKLGRSLQTIGKHGFEVDGEVYDTLEDFRYGRDLRSMFVPRRGKIFVEGDLSQADARSVAVLSEDWDLLRSFDAKPKLHAKTAGMIYDIDPTTIDKNGPIIPNSNGILYYDMGKRIRHAGNFGMGPARLAQMTQLPLNVCKNLMDKFHALNPKIRNIFHGELDRHIRRHQSLVTPFGRRRDFFDRYSESLFKEGVAYIPQSVTGDAIKFPMVDIRRAAPWVTFLIEMHDGILVEIDAERKEEYAQIFKKWVEVPINFGRCSLSRDYDLVIPSELSWSSENWFEMEDLKC